MVKILNSSPYFPPASEPASAYRNGEAKVNSSRAPDSLPNTALSGEIDVSDSGPRTYSELEPALIKEFGEEITSTIGRLPELETLDPKTIWQMAEDMRSVKEGYDFAANFLLK